MSVKYLTKDEKIMLRELSREIKRLEKDNKSIRPVAILPPTAYYAPEILLYENRIEDNTGLMYMLDDPKIKIEYFQSGDVQFTSEVSGGGTRIGSLTNTVIGGLIGGGAGAAIGAMTPHSSGIYTRQVKHDTRNLVLRITGPRGIIAFSEPFTNDFGGDRKRFKLVYFHDRLLEAIDSYKRNKKAIDAKYKGIMDLKKQYFRIENDYDTPSKAKRDIKKNSSEKYAQNQKISSKERQATKAKQTSISKKKQENNSSVSTGLIPSILSLALFLLPVVGFTLGIVGLVQSIIFIRRVNGDGKAIAALIMSILGVLWGLLYSLVFISIL